MHSAQVLRADEAQDALQRFFEDVKTLDGTFTQAVFDERGELLQQSKGTVKLQRPGHFRWDYQTPFAQLILADGRHLWIYDSDLAQVTVKALDSALGATPISLLTDFEPLDEHFVVRKSSRKDDLLWVSLEPRIQDTDFSRVAFALDELGVKEMHLSDQFGQRTVIQFSDIKINRPLPESTFRFDVPEGVDVIGTFESSARQ
jgi:outer membrane lipoprotein carrier protein